MVIQVANPIYDAVFKFLMEDLRVAKIILSALLRKQIIDVEVRRNEHANITRNDISMFRIDFGARVREHDGTERLILIELQKTWVETETLRFRQYLGLQYSDPANMITEEKAKREEAPGQYALPMVSVYILGHKVGKIDEPVLYVSHEAYDYEGKRVTKGLPDPFVDSLVHDSIIVQIPRLRGQVNSKLDRVLGIFDQSQVMGHNRHVLNIDDDKYGGDDDMQHVLHRLIVASANVKLREEMIVEDEFFRAIEDRDTAIMVRDEQLKEKDEQLSEKDEQLSEKDAQLSEKDAQLSEQQAQLSEQQAQLSEQQAQLKKKDTLIQSMARTLQQHGMSVEAIAETIHLPVPDVKALLDNMPPTSPKP